MGEEHRINEIKGVIISRALLKEYGYDGDMPTDKQMQVIGNGLLEYWGVSDGFKAALKDKSPQISENNTVITCAGGLEIWDICCISSDAEAFGLKPSFGYDGHTRITFTPKE